MKLLTITIPCYNSQAYMKKCIEHALLGGDEVEIIVVDDGSTDDTAKIADDYAKRYPNIVKAIHKENGGHGDAVSCGIKAATGTFFKVCDSDDWLDKKAFPKVLDKLREVRDAGTELDMLLTNYIYDKVGRRYKRVMRYTDALPEEEILSWDTVKLRFKRRQFVMMHSVIYRTAMLQEMGLELPKHTFYVDNIYVFQPMLRVKTFMFLNVDLYHYYIGREGQSVNEKTMIKRIDQQLFINKYLIDYFSENKPENPELYKFLRKYVDMMMCVSSSLCLVGKTKELLEKKRDLWKYLKEKDKQLYKELRRSLLGVFMNFPGAPGRAVSRLSYRITQKLFGFN